MCAACDLADAKSATRTKPATRRIVRLRTTTKARLVARRAMRAARTSPASLITHEHYLQAIQRLVVAQSGLTKADKAKLRSIKLVYGAGQAGVRGVTYYSRWRQANAKAAVPFVELCAFSQHSHVQVCGTLVHELGHVLAGHEHGHGPGWFSVCARLGLGDTERGCTPILAAGTSYDWECFAPDLRAQLQALPTPTDGQPVGNAANLLGKLLGPHGRPMTQGMLKPKPCGAGYGAKGGLSRGIGSGSRNLLWECSCDGSKPSMARKPIKIRHAGTDLEARCMRCGTMFAVVEKSIPAASTNGTGKLAPGSIKRRPAKAAKAKGHTKAKAKARKPAGTRAGRSARYHKPL